MNLEQLKNAIAEAYSAQIEWLEDPFMNACRVSANDLYSFIHTLYSNKKLNFNFLTDITAVHYPDLEGREFEVVYHLHNLYDNIRLKIKVAVSLENPHVPSIVDIYSGANWMERETFDFYGIIFDNHPNLTRILNADDMTIHPMRKEYPMEDPTRIDKDDQMFGRG